MKLTHKNFDIKDNHNSVTIISPNEVLETDTRLAKTESKEEISDISREDIKPIQNVQFKNKDQKCILWSCSSFITNRLFKYSIYYRRGNLPNEFLFIVQLDKDIIITKVTSTFIKHFKTMNYSVLKIKEMDKQDFDNLAVIQTTAIKQALSRCISHTSYDDNNIASLTFMDIYNNMEEQYDDLIMKECNNIDLDNKLFNNIFINTLRDRLIFNFKYYG